MLLSVHGGMATGWQSAEQAALYDLSELPLPTAEEWLLFVLSYVKGNPLQSNHGTIFGMRQGKTNVWLQVLLPVLYETLRTLGVAPSRSLRTLAEQLGLPAAEAEALAPEAAGRPSCHDATERRIPRPQDDAEQAACYSGKKKSHTVKNLRLLDPTLHICFLSATVDGHVHDKRLADTGCPLVPYPLPHTVGCCKIWAFSALPWLASKACSPSKSQKAVPLPRRRKLSIANSPLCACALSMSSVVSNAAALSRTSVGSMSSVPGMPSWKLLVPSIISVFLSSPGSLSLNRNNVYFMDRGLCG